MDANEQRAVIAEMREASDCGMLVGSATLDPWIARLEALAQQVPTERLQDVTLGERLLALHARLDAKLGAGFIDDIPGDELSAIREAAAALSVRGDVSVEWVVNCSMGHGPNPHFDDKAKAVARWQEESAIPSYVRPGQLRKASITKVTTITQDCTPATPPSEG